MKNFFDLNLLSSEGFFHDETKAVSHLTHLYFYLTPEEYKGEVDIKNLTYIAKFFMNEIYTLIGLLDKKNTQQYSKWFDYRNTNSTFDDFDGLVSNIKLESSKNGGLLGDTIYLFDRVNFNWYEVNTIAKYYDNEDRYYIDLEIMIGYEVISPECYLIILFDDDKYLPYLRQDKFKKID